MSDPVPVEGVVLPALDVTMQDRKAAHAFNCSPVKTAEDDRLKTAEECCRERQLSEVIAQRDEMISAYSKAIEDAKDSRNDYANLADSRKMWKCKAEKAEAALATERARRFNFNGDNGV